MSVRGVPATGDGSQESAPLSETPAWPVGNCRSSCPHIRPPAEHWRTSETCCSMNRVNGHVAPHDGLAA